jgi:hypothetical protein
MKTTVAVYRFRGPGVDLDCSGRIEHADGVNILRVQGEVYTLRQVANRIRLHQDVVAFVEVAGDIVAAMPLCRARIQHGIILSELQAVIG